jgi:peptidoglycan hydrolase-like protein with peptidoglycan-binding domain
MSDSRHSTAHAQPLQAPEAQHSPEHNSLSMGSQGEPVTQLQQTLKLLGYFEGEVNGSYAETTADAVSRFQKSTSLPGVTTALVAQAKTQSSPAPIWTSPWVLGGLGATGVVGATILALTRRSSSRTDEVELEKGLLAELPPAPASPPMQNLNGLSAIEETISETVTSKGFSATPPRDAAGSLQNHQAIGVAPNPKISETSRMSKINIVDELVQDLRNPDPVKRHKIIWELGQRGDTRAVQPLVDLMVDSDSRQRSLILSALSEIGTRTLKPLTRALAISLQDENAEVRKNAIRDLTRVYDMVAQISNLLHQASDDPDQDVQETARWALTQLNRIRPTNGSELPALKHGVSPPESLP